MFFTEVLKTEIFDYDIVLILFRMFLIGICEPSFFQIVHQRREMYSMFDLIQF